MSEQDRIDVGANKGSLSGASGGPDGASTDRPGDGAINRCVIYLMRHGDSRPDEAPRFVGRTDYPLNATGRAQAEWWQRGLASVPFERVYCSDRRRSRETARMVCGDRRIPFTELSELAEIDLGDWDGMPIAEARTRFPQEYAERGADIADYRIAGGESFTDVAERAVPAFETLSRQSVGPVLAVGHSGVNRVLLSHMLGMPLANLLRLEQAYCCLNVVERIGESWVVRQMNVLPNLPSIG